ncbi:pyridoxal-phosphate dependent enzyme, partial [Pseudoalteromonas sp. CAL494-MNA-CIBAN-0108]
TGVSRYLKNEKGLNVKSIAVEPTNSPVISQTLAGEEIKPGPHKIQGIGAGFIPGNLDLSVIDGAEQVSNEDAIAMAHLLMRQEGI